MRLYSVGTQRCVVAHDLPLAARVGIVRLTGGHHRRAPAASALHENIKAKKDISYYYAVRGSLSKFLRARIQMLQVAFEPSLSLHLQGVQLSLNQWRLESNWLLRLSRHQGRTIAEIQMADSVPLPQGDRFTLQRRQACVCLQEAGDKQRVASLQH
jgi:hypothetical protein